MAEALVDQIAASLRQSLDLSTERQRMLAARMIIAEIVAPALAEAEARGMRAEIERAERELETRIAFCTKMWGPDSTRADECRVTLNILRALATAAPAETEERS